MKQLIKRPHYLYPSKLILISFFCLSLCTALSLNFLWQSTALATDSLQSNTHVQTTIASPNELIQQGHEYYAEGQYDNAIQVWQRVAQHFLVENNYPVQASILSHIALAHQQMGNLATANGVITTSLDLLTRYPHSAGDDYFNILGQILTTQGSLALSQSQPAAALKAFEQASNAYRRNNNSTGILRSQINQAQALQALGFYRRALVMLTEGDASLLDSSPSLLRVAGLRKLGDLYRITGDLDKSEDILQKSLTMGQQLGSTVEVAQTHFSVGNTARVQGHVDKALHHYQQTTNLTTSSLLVLQANIARLDLYFDMGRTEQSVTLFNEVQQQFENVSISRNTLYAKLELARSLLDNKTQQYEKLVPILTQALEQSKQLQDKRSESYALGYLGRLYVQAGALQDAQPLFAQALTIANTENAADIAYRWQWQLGQIQSQLGDTDRAIETYTDAINSLESLRSELVATNPDIQYDFRERVEPVYRQLVDLLLTPTPTQPDISQDRLVKARNTIESLQLAELENFFREPCLAPREQIDQVVDNASSRTAVIYPIILPNRVELILKLPGQPLQHYATPIAQQSLEDTVASLRENILKPYSLNQVKSLSTQLHDWLLKPAEASLVANHIDTLVFVLDGVLRNIPMAVLYDGKHYLIENYSLALAPGLQLVDPEPLAKKKLAAIAAGLSEARHGFSPLTFVLDEVEQIKTSLTSEILLDQTFTQNALENAINQTPFPIVHLATHGQFSSDPQKTFILAWDKRIPVNALNKLLRNSEQNRQDAIELLVLSACQTATGDKRAALGLAGISVRAGARSTLASLWNLDDKASAVLMRQFYKNLIASPKTKAASLREAQLSLLKSPRYQHPSYWAPFVLIGNWL